MMNIKWMFVFFITLAGAGWAEVVACEDLDMNKLIAAEKVGNQEEFEKELNVMLPLGADEAKVVYVLSALKELGWEYIYDEAHNAYSASKKLKGGFFGKKQVNMNVFLDDEKRVREIDIYVSSTSFF